MSEERKKDGISLGVPTAQSKKSARPTSPTDSSHSSRSTSPAGAMRSQLPAGQLSVELQCKVSAQMARLSVLQDMQERLPRIATLEHLLEFRGNIEDTFKMFLREHAYLETVWPAGCLDHPYFKENAFLQAHRAAGLLKEEIGKLRSLFSTPSASSISSAEVRAAAKLPDISLPKFSGVYKEWPAFSDMFKSLILDNRVLSDVQRLHYLRGCLRGEAADLIANQPLDGDSFSQSWELLKSQYENKRLLIQARLDQIHSAPTAQKTATSMNKLINTVAQAKKALLKMGVEATLGDIMLVHSVSRKLDAETKEAWEISLGLSQDYPTFEQLHAFVAARARAQERLESEKPSPTTSAQTKRTAQPSAAPRSTGAVSRTAAFASGSTAHPCDQCDGHHFIVACEQFRGLTPAARREVVERKRLCFNCLGRHSAKSCRSSQKCKTCSGRHHTMLHVQSGSSKQGSSDKAQPSSSAH